VQEEEAMRELLALCLGEVVRVVAAGCDEGSNDDDDDDP
jgi:hypothetical protein